MAFTCGRLWKLVTTAPRGKWDIYILNAEDTDCINSIVALVTCCVNSLDPREQQILFYSKIFKHVLMSDFLAYAVKLNWNEYHKAQRIKVNGPKPFTLISFNQSSVGMVSFTWIQLTHWGRGTHICISKLTIIGSDNGLSPFRRQALSESMLEYC